MNVLPVARPVDDDDAAFDRTLALDLLSRADLVRLKAIARLHAFGLPPGMSGADLLHEAILRTMQGTRVRPPDVPLVAFLAETMRSIKSEQVRRYRRERDAATPEPRAVPDPERIMAATQELAAIYRLFADDRAATQILNGVGAGWSAEEIRKATNMSKTDYNSARKRMRRAFLRAGLTGRRS